VKVSVIEMIVGGMVGISLLLIVHFLFTRAMKRRELREDDMWNEVYKVEESEDELSLTLSDEDDENKEKLSIEQRYSRKALKNFYKISSHKLNKK
jgi:hypothetical protein